MRRNLGAWVQGRRHIHLTITVRSAGALTRRKRQNDASYGSILHHALHTNLSVPHAVCAGFRRPVIHVVWYGPTSSSSQAPSFDHVLLKVGHTWKSISNVAKEHLQLELGPTGSRAKLQKAIVSEVDAETSSSNSVASQGVMDIEERDHLSQCVLDVLGKDS